MEYFTYEELIYSETALKKRIRNKTTRQVEANLARLVSEILDPLRKAYGRAIIVNSGYRCAALNKAVGGASTSQHTTGCAADIDAGSVAANRELARLIVRLNLPYDQLIDEKNYAWVHVSIADGKAARKEILRYNGKSYQRIGASEL